MEVGRRLLFNKKTGDIIMDFGEMQGDVLPREELNEDNIGIVELEFGEYREEFSRMKAVIVNTETKELEFELYPKEQTESERIEELENELLLASGVI